MSPQLFKVIGGSCILLACLLLFIQILIQRKRSEFIIKVKEKQKINRHAQKVYKYFIKVPLLRRYLSSIKDRLIITTDGDEEAVISLTMKLFMFACIAICIFLIFFSFLVREWYIWCVLIIVLYFIFETIIDFFIQRLKNQLLEQLIKFIDYLRNAYFETQMIDEAYLSALDKLEGSNFQNIKKQGQMIYDLLTQADGELALQRYYQVAPNSYLKLLAGLSYIVKEYGDTQIDSSSSFVKSLSHLSSEVKDEIIKRNRLSFGLRSMNFIAISPLLAMQPIKNWASASFYPLKQFYSGSLGFVVEMGLLIIILLSYSLLRRIQYDHDDNTSVQDGFKIEKFINAKIPRFISWLTPSTQTKSYEQIKKRQIRAHTFIKMEFHFARKFLVALIAFILAFSIVLISLNIQKNSVLTTPTTPQGFLAGELTGKALEDATALTHFDNLVLKEGQHSWQREALGKYLSQEYDLRGEKKKHTIDRLLHKQSLLDKSNLKPIHLIIIYIITLIGWLIPEWYLIVKQHLLKSDIEIEISRFQLVIMMLMHVEMLTVDSVLEWFEKFSVLFKVPIQATLMNYDAGAKDALDELKSVSDRPDFQTIVNHLITCVESLTIREAFSEFESEKRYYQDKRRLINEHVVKNKIFLGQIIGFIPIYGLMLLYFMFPLIYASIQEMQTYFDKLSF